MRPSTLVISTAMAFLISSPGHLPRGAPTPRGSTCGSRGRESDRGVNKGAAMMYRTMAAIVAALVGTATLLASAADQLVYADFEKVENGRPVSARGGLIQMFGYEESKVHKAEFKGTPGLEPGAPELVHIKPGDPNHAMKFDFVLHAPNDWTGVTVEIHGLPDADGKEQAEDLSGYKTLSLQVYAKGIQFLRLQAVSKSSGKDSSFAWPLKNFQVREGFNTYKMQLSAFAQPTWAPVKVDSKSIFKELTSINVSAFCDQCAYSQQGM